MLIFGTTDVTNNKFGVWLVKEFIAQERGEEVDWAGVGVVTARELARGEIALEGRLGRVVASGSNFRGSDSKVTGVSTKHDGCEGSNITKPQKNDMLDGAFSM